MKRKLLCLVLIALLLCVSLCGCGKKAGGTLKIDGKTISVSSLISLDKTKVPFDIFRYCYMSIKSSMESDDPEIDWNDQKNQKTLLDEATGEVKFLYAVRSTAKKYGYKLDKAALEEVDSTMKSTFDSAGGATEYKKLLAQNYLSHESYKFIVETNSLYSLLGESLIGADKEKNKIIADTDKALEIYNKEYYRLVDIYFPVEEAQNQEATDEEFEASKKEAEKKVNSAMEQLKSGKEFSAVMDEFLGETAYDSNVNGYYPISTINSGLGVDLSSLEYGKYSDIIYANSCYHIVLRLENDNEYLKTNNLSSVIDCYAKQALGDILDDVSDKFKVKESEYYSKITPEAIS